MMASNHHSGVDGNHHATKSRGPEDPDKIVIPKDPAALGPWRRFFEEYTQWLNIRGYAERTVESYTDYSSRFLFWLCRREIMLPGAITPEIAMAFQRAVYYHRTPKGEQNPPLSQCRMLVAVRSFTKFLKKSGYALVDPGLAIEMPKTPTYLPRIILTEEEMTRLLAAPDIGTVKGYRDRTILELLYSSGIRAKELFNLETRDVNLGDSQESLATVTIRQGKGRKDRVVPLGEIAAEFLAGYMKNIRPRYARETGQARALRVATLFLGYHGKPLHPESLMRDIRRYCRKAGIEKHAVIHTFRHTCATHMLKGGAGLRHIQALLGHESVVTTERYTRVEIGDLMKVHAKFHPRTKL